MATDLLAPTDSVTPFKDVMSKVDTPLPMARVPLVRELTQLGLGQLPRSSPSFVERLSASIDLARAMDLSDALRAPQAPTKSPMTPSNGTALQQICREHYQAMVSVIEQSFTGAVPGQGVQGLSSRSFRLPEVVDTLIDQPDGVAVYLRFYALQQSEMERRVKMLQGLLLAQLSDADVKGARLAVVDRALEPTLAKYARKCFAQIPNLLSKRFEILREQQKQQDLVTDSPSTPELWLAPRGWLRCFINELHRFLLAELQLRLEPSKGLLEALQLPPELLGDPEISEGVITTEEIL